MDRYFICLANSYKHGGRCLAGIEIAFNADNKPVIMRHEDNRPRWIRPISDEPNGIIPNNVAERIKLFTVVKLRDAIPCPNRAQTEDTKYLQIECGYGSFIPNDDLLKLCLDNRHQNVFFSQGKAVPAELFGRLDYSLMLIRPEQPCAYIDENREKSKCRMKFSYFGSHYDLAITDPVFLEALKKEPERYAQLQNVYLTLSLGLEFEGFHFKLVAAVIFTEETKQDSPKAEKTTDDGMGWFYAYEQRLALLINQKKEIEEQIAVLREELTHQMELHHEDIVRSSLFTVSYVPAKTVMQFDGKLFREEHLELYSNYCKPKQKNASIVVRRNKSSEE